MTTGRVARALASVVLIALAGCGKTAPTKASDISDVPQQAVKFTTADGKTLTGRLFGHGRVGVTLAHMYPSDATSWYPAAARIAKAGYMALAFNFRGYADSEGPVQINRAPIDIAGAEAYLKHRGAKDIAFVGASMGGTASIIAATSGHPLAVVSVSGPATFRGLDAPTYASGVQRPVMLMASRGDTEAFDALELLQRALPNPDTKIYDGDAHGTNLLDARPEAVDVIIAFLKRYAPLSGPNAG